MLLLTMLNLRPALSEVPAVSCLGHLVWFQPGSLLKARPLPPLWLQPLPLPLLWLQPLPLPLLPRYLLT